MKATLETEMANMEQLQDDYEGEKQNLNATIETHRANVADFDVQLQAAVQAAAEAATKTATEQRLKQDISICIGRFRKMQIPRNDVVKIIAEDYSMNEKEAQNCVDECWTA